MKRWILLAFVFLLSILAYHFKPVEWMDLYRYNIKYWDNVPVYTSILDFIEMQFYTEFDFLYGLSFLLAKKIGLTASVVNAFYVGLYYFTILYIVRALNIGSPISCRHIFIISFFCFFIAQPVTIFSISRQVSSMIMLFWALYFYNKGRKKYYVVFLVLSIFYHIGNLIVILPVVFSILYWKKIARMFRRKTTAKSFLQIGFISLCVLIFSRYLFQFVQQVLYSSGIFSLNERYEESYLSGVSDGSLGIHLSLGNLSTIAQYVILYVNISLVKDRKVIWCMCFCIYILMCLCFFNFEFLVRRYTIALAIPSALLLMKIYRERKGMASYSLFLVLLSLVTLVSNLTYKEYLFSFWGWLYE